MPKVILENRSILLENGDWDASPSYLKFENMWFESYNFNGWIDFILMPKLRSLKKDIINWNKEEFGKLETGKGSKALDNVIGKKHRGKTIQYS
ncbi:hypothetical protein H5410_050570 [Solanum commersonii]|uniref:Uncharacterized protein n=1 Tax=Solanum commersonii TaxID=4109 RepID=A0A9J5WX57_SOLCO|nr:hypothetical protein H5410_050570 [Solanum commersonii]